MSANREELAAKILSGFCEKGALEDIWVGLILRMPRIRLML